MNITELLVAAKNTPVTKKQIDALRARLQKQSNDKSAAPSKEFLERTYNL